MLSARFSFSECFQRGSSCFRKLSRIFFAVLQDLRHFFQRMCSIEVISNAFSIKFGMWQSSGITTLFPGQNYMEYGSNPRALTHSVIIHRNWYLLWCITWRHGYQSHSKFKMARNDGGFSPKCINGENIHLRFSNEVVRMQEETGVSMVVSRKY